MYFVKSFKLYQKNVLFHNLIITAMWFSGGRKQKAKEENITEVSLDKALENKVYRVKSICLSPLVAKRLNELGLITGTQVSRTLTAPSGDPIAYLIRGAQIALRKKDAECVIVETESDISDTAFTNDL